MSGKVNGSHDDGVKAIRAELAPEKKVELPPDEGDDKSGK